MKSLEALKPQALKQHQLPEEQQVDQYVRDRLTRTEARMEQLLPSINERYEFWRGNQYAHVTSDNKLAFLATKTTKHGGG